MGVGRGRKRKEGEGRRMTKTDGTLPPPQNHFFFFLTSSDLSSLEEESQCEGCYGEIPEPPFRFPPRGPPLHLRAPHSTVNSTHETAIADQLRPFQGIVGGVCYTAIEVGEGGKSQRAFSLKLDGLLPSCVSPPPLPLGWPRRPGPSDPSSAGPCLQTEGR